MKKIGIFSFTCCEGCVVVFVEALNKKYDEWKDKLQFENIRILKRVKPVSEMDIALVEGAISTPSEVNKLKKIREKAKVLIAFGSGAINGFPSNQRNKFNKKMKEKIQPILEHYKQNPTIEPINKFVKVDDKIPGCPPDEETLIKKIDSYLK